MIKVLHILNNFNGGGIEAVVMNYFRAIDKNEFHFDIACSENSKLIPENEVNSLGGTIYKLPSLKHPFKYITNVKKLAKGYNIIHCHMGPLAFLPLMACKLAGSKVRICHCHTTTSPKEVVRNIGKIIFKPLSKHFATHYFACGKKAGDWMFKDNYKIIYNAIDTSKFSSYSIDDISKIKKELGIESNEKIYLHIGRFNTQKNHEFLIDVFERVHELNPKSKLILIGDGSLKKNIEQQVKKLKLENNVMFLGQIEDTSKYYAIADVFLLPSLYEGLPVVLVEAQAAKTPCLVSDTVSKEIAFSKAIRFESLDKERWINAIQDFNEDFVTSNEFVEKYEIKHQVKRLEKLYKELV